MKAMVINRFGGPEEFVPMERAVPEVSPGQVLIRVSGSSVNPVDWKIRSGLIPALAPEMPAILHGDVAGWIEAVGHGVDNLQPGDEVYACAGGFKRLGGALAEYMLASADLVAPKPATLSLQEAAVLPLVSITAWESLIDRARVEAGQRVLVHAGTGGVGHIGLQLAKWAGAIVYTTVSNERKAEEARSLGADEVIDYREHTVAEYVQQHTHGEGFDVVFDTVGDDNLTGSFEAVRPGGTVVTIAARSTQDLTPLHGKSITLHCVFMGLPLITGKGRAHHGDILIRLARLIDSGRIRPLIDPKVFAFKDVGKAHQKLQDGKAMGKIALEAAF
ncbi:MAG: zinc-dependent alcohol dehydrogenase family protein [Planctomycetes bacterium]|nr:zinc-dependent alcohol dehydrogenase family protein [Planctomycetota bacterium]